MWRIEPYPLFASQRVGMELVCDRRPVLAVGFHPVIRRKILHSAALKVSSGDPLGASAECGTVARWTAVHSTTGISP